MLYQGLPFHHMNFVDCLQTLFHGPVPPTLSTWPPRPQSVGTRSFENHLTEEVIAVCAAHVRMLLRVNCMLTNLRTVALGRYKFYTEFRLRRHIVQQSRTRGHNASPTFADTSQSYCLAPNHHQQSRGRLSYFSQFIRMYFSTTIIYISTTELTALSSQPFAWTTFYDVEDGQRCLPQHQQLDFDFTTSCLDIHNIFTAYNYELTPFYSSKSPP